MDRTKLNGLSASFAEQKTTTDRSRGKMRSLLRAGVFACCVLSVLGLRGYTSRGPAHGSSLIERAAVAANHSQPARVMQAVAVKPKLTESVLITITPGGFDTAQITSPAIPFFLLIENRSGLSDVSFRLDRVGGSRLRQATVGREQPDWADLLDLSPGDYVLSEANHPGWICHITVTPN